ncbi:MAG TPA: sugar dehydrogenase, partial [Cyanobacteria bacterium UBA11049]|nr:sugar dehydrogenase [Cyanobacteria bacterium UBA11049]
LNQVGNDNISSLRVPAGYKVRVCEDETGGICREYGAGDYSYVGDDLNDQISLVEVKVQ